jgi:SpoVK/Ycf46/Vps4 family AAA+-type ATPase
MDLWNYLAGGAAFGLIAACWDRIKGVLWQISSLLIQHVEIEEYSAHDALVAYLVTQYPRSRFYDRIYGSEREFHGDGSYGLIPYEHFGMRTIVFWNGWRPFVFNNAIEKKAETNRNGRERTEDYETLKIHSTLTFLRGTLDMEKLLCAASAASDRASKAAENTAQEKRNRFVIHFVPRRCEAEHDRDYGANGLAWYQTNSYRLLSHRPEQLGKARTQGKGALANLIFPERVKKLIKEIELWRSSRSWYLEKGIPWKRGWLLYGPPGTGKTALARAFAEDLNLPIYVYNLADLSNRDFIRAWTRMQVNVPCIALIEDIDNVFHGRENVARKNSATPLVVERKRNDTPDSKRPPFAPLTFDCLLNCLDGVERANGIFTIITTNDISKVDPALGQPRKTPSDAVECISTRPGRIDKAVELTFMEAAEKRRMARRILGEFPDRLREVIEFIERFSELPETPAQFQERCSQIALAQFWQERCEVAVDAVRPAETSDVTRGHGAQRQDVSVHVC